MGLQPLQGIGIDISNHHVRFACVSRFHGVLEMQEIQIPDGIVVDEKVVQPEKLKALIFQGIRQSRLGKKTYRTTALVPESRVFSSSMVMPGSAKKPGIRNQAIRKAQQKIPIPFNQAAIVLAQGKKTKAGHRVNVYVSQKEVLNGLARAVSLPTFKPMAFEVNSKALLRLFTKFAPKKERAIGKKGIIGVVDVGHSWTTIAIYTLFGSLLFSRTLSHKQKETNGELSEETVKSIVETIQEVVQFFTQHKMHISLFMLGGVEAMQPNLVSAVKQQKEFRAAPVSDLVVLKGISKKDLHRFGAAIGAAYRSVQPRKYAYQHNFLKSKKK